MQTDYPQGSPPAPPPPPPAPTTEGVIEPYRSPRSVATTLLVFFGIALTVDVIGALSSVAELSLLQRAQAGEIVSFDEAQANDARQGAIGLAQLLIFAILIIVFIVWFRRLYRNLPALGARGLRFKPGWAVGAWFVPFLNWVRPVQIMNDIWKASDPESASHEDSTWPSRSSTPLIGLWWATWIISNFVGRYSFSTVNQSDDLDKLQEMSRSFIAADITSAVAAIFALALVWRVTARQEARAVRLSVLDALPA